MVIESDGGVWNPFGYTFNPASVSDAEFAALVQHGKQVARLGAGNVTYGGAGVGQILRDSPFCCLNLTKPPNPGTTQADTAVWCPTVPCGSQVVVDPITGLQPTPTPEGSGYFCKWESDPRLGMFRVI